MEDKTQFTSKHAQILFQTMADIIGERYNVKIIAKVKEKGGLYGRNNEKKR